MPIGSKEKYTDKQRRKAEEIYKSYRDKGVSKDEAEARAWATVNKQSGGGNNPGGGGRVTSESRKKQERRDSSRRAAATRQGKTLQGQLEQKTREELMRKARQKNIRGRSTMRKQELITALKKSA
jgi:plasmid stabilization system protein ParE